jgi:hypothetical protein
MKCSCGADWFLEEKLIRPAGLPREPQRTELPKRDMPRYRYRCVDCGLIYGQEVQREPEPTKEPDAPKKRGRPPKPKTTEQE